MTVAASATQLHGMLVIRKPTGMVSKDVTRWFERRLGRLHIGHVGTLDPLAEGVLPLLFGRATRLQDYLLTHQKSYEFDVRFGVATDTLDSDGAIVAEGPWEHVTSEELAAAAATLEGEWDQVPPLYSAVKYKGIPLYEYARSGRAADVPIEELKKRVQIYSLKLIRYADGVGTFQAVCAKGVYVRILATKLAEKVGSYGMVTRLVRLASSGVRLEDAHSLAQVEEGLDRLQDFLIPMSAMDLGLPRWRAGAESVRRLQNGQQVIVLKEHFAAGIEGNWNERDEQEIILLADDGQAFGLGLATVRRDGNIWVIMKRGLL